MPDLELATTEEIWNELRKRHPIMILVFEEDDKLNSNESEVSTRWSGGYLSGIGLARYTEKRIYELIARQSHEDSDD